MIEVFGQVRWHCENKGMAADGGGFPSLPDAPEHVAVVVGGPGCGE